MNYKQELILHIVCVIGIKLMMLYISMYCEFSDESEEYQDSISNLERQGRSHLTKTFQWHIVSLLTYHPFPC